MKFNKIYVGLTLLLSCMCWPLWAQKTKQAHTMNASHYEVAVQGACIFANSWNNLGEGELTPMGIYQMNQSEGYEVKPFLINSAVYSNGGGAFIGNDFWFIWKQRDPTGQMTLCQRERLNLTTGKRENLGVCSNDLMATAAGTAVDPTTGNVYGIFWDSESMTSRQLGIVDYPNGTRTTIATISQSLYALCCDSAGQLYAVTQSGKLVKVDKEDGMLTEVGNTGVKPSVMQAAAVDQYTNKMYWAAVFKDEKGNDAAALYEVDLATAQATKLADYPDLNEFSALRVLAPKAKDEAPAPATDLKTLFNKASTTGTFTFTMPTETFAGKQLSGELSYQVTIDGEKAASGKGSAGETVSVSVTTNTGLHEFAVTTNNDKGVSPEATVSKYTGYDKPLAPKNVELVIDENANKAHLSWEAPANLGENEGYVDVQNLTYNILRHPDEKEFNDVSGTSFDDALTPSKAMMYSYDVAAVNHARKGKAATSNAVMYGTGYDVPWTENFNNASSLNMFTVVDVNQDGSSWSWSRFKTKAVIYTYNSENAADDWLITPPIAMKAGRKYKLSFLEHVTLSRYPEKLEIKFGEGLDPNIYVEVMPKTTYTNAEFVSQAVYVSPSSDGNYHFGFHACSDANQGLLYIDDMSVDVEPESTAPAAATQVEASAAEYGMNPVTISFNAPQKAINGQKLSALEKVEVTDTKGNVIKAFENPAPGERLSCKDENAAKGINAYYIVAYNEHGIGQRAKVTAFIGTDVPSAPRNITVSGNEDGTLKMTWNAPEKGKNGGFINPSQLSYTAYTVDDEGYANLYKENIKGTEVSLADLDNTGEQRLERFGASASNNEGESDIMPSNSVVMGDAYSLPFAESFANEHLAYDVWYSQATGSNGFEVDDKIASDNDGACVAFEAAEDDAIAAFCSGKIALNNCEAPVLTFDYYGEPGTKNVLITDINRSYVDTTAVKVIDFSKEGAPSGWKRAVVNLSQFKSAPYVQLVFLCQIAKQGDVIRVDNIRIENNPALAVSGVAFDTPTTGELIYTLSGIRMGNVLSKGVYIRDGKKLFMK